MEAELDLGSTLCGAIKKWHRWGGDMKLEKVVV